MTETPSHLVLQEARNRGPPGESGTLKPWLKAAVDSLAHKMPEKGTRPVRRRKPMSRRVRKRTGDGSVRIQRVHARLKSRLPVRMPPPLGTDHLPPV